MKQVLTMDFTSSDEEDPETHQKKKKKILTWQSELLTTKEFQLEKTYFVRAAPQTKHSLTKYTGVGSFSDGPAPQNAPLWALKLNERH